MERLDTAYGHFLPSNDRSSSILLRGVNLSSSSKYPSLPPRQATAGADQNGGMGGDADSDAWLGAQSWVDDNVLWEDAEAGGREGWFNGHPFDLDDAEVHLRRLKACGFKMIRYIVTWEALEHAGPGKYDESYIDYIIAVLRLCQSHGFRVFISCHQDVFSRFLGGSGAPYWVLLAVGLNPRRLHQTGSAMLHSAWPTQGYGGTEKSEAGAEWPDMVWQTNLHRLAARHCFTMFFASERYAPKCRIDGVPMSDWLQHHFNEAYGRLAERLRDANLLDDCVVGWDSMNEPDGGFIGLPDLTQFPPFQSFKKGASPTPLQGLQLGVGQAVSEIAVFDFTSLGEKKRGKVGISPPSGQGAWLTGEEAMSAAKRWGWEWGSEWKFWDKGGCPYAGHGVWDPKTGEVLQPHYFKDGNFMEDYWRPHAQSLITRLRKAQPDAISFINPPVFEKPPDFDEEVKNGRVALSSHFYDGLTLLAKRRHVFNADAVGIQRGLKPIFKSLKFGSTQIRSVLKDQLNELKSDASRSESLASETAYPTIIGELGIPFDMKNTNMLGLAKGKVHPGDYTQPSKSMDELLSACALCLYIHTIDKNGLSFTLWVYEPRNTHRYGDGWNGEDLSIFCLDDVHRPRESGAAHSHPAPTVSAATASRASDVRTLLLSGTRGIRTWCRPYCYKATGRLGSATFDPSSSAFEVTINVDVVDKLRSEEGPKTGIAKVYIPFVHYLASEAVASELASSTVDAETERGKTSRLIGDCDSDSKLAEWVPGRPGRVDLDIQHVDGKVKVQGQWMTWTYPVGEKQETVKLSLRRWERALDETEL